MQQSPVYEELSASYWRKRAREAEQIATEAGPLNKHILEGVACSYHEMADLVRSYRMVPSQTLANTGSGVSPMIRARKFRTG